jgi:hypothetical protein
MKVEDGEDDLNAINENAFMDEMMFKNEETKEGDLMSVLEGVDSHDQKFKVGYDTPPYSDTDPLQKSQSSFLC